MTRVEAGDLGRSDTQTQIVADQKLRGGVGSTVPMTTEWIVCIVDRSGAGVCTVRSR